MSRTPRLIALAASAVVLMTLAVAPGSAHKPITSPFTYNEDVFPILRDRCGQCHTPGGVAPMSLMTYDDTVPWGESIRVELLARHMPPWSVDAAPVRFRNALSLSAREMNVLLTWATGGTPLGNPDKTPPAEAHERGWPLGAPDLELPLDEFTLSASAQEATTEFVVRTGLPETRLIRAIDIAPGTPAIVRSATVQIKAAAAGSPTTIVEEPVLTLWLPGDEPAAAEDAGFLVPAGAELLVRIRYKKTWQYERRELRDRSRIGLYFAPEGSASIGALKLVPPRSHETASGRLSFSTPVGERVHALAIYPDRHPDNVGIVVTAVDAAGVRRELIAFHPRVEWARRYWFQGPIALDPGTTLETTVTVDDETPALPLAPATGSSPQELSDVGLTLNVIAGQ